MPDFLHIDTTRINAEMLSRAETVLDGIDYDSSKAEMMYAIGFASAIIELSGKIFEAGIALTAEVNAE